MLTLGSLFSHLKKGGEGCGEQAWHLFPCCFGAQKQGRGRCCWFSRLSEVSLDIACLDHNIGVWGSLPSACVCVCVCVCLYHQRVCVLCVCVCSCVCSPCVWGGGIFRHTPPAPRPRGAVLSLTRVIRSRLVHEIRHCTCCALRPGDPGACGRRAGSHFIKVTKK